LAQSLLKITFDSHPASSIVAMSTVRVPPQHGSRSHSSILHSLLILCLVVLVSFFAGASWSRATSGSDQVSQHQFANQLDRVSQAVAGNSTDKADLADSKEAEADNVHIYFLLDRSGSMQSIASDVIAGFNAFVKEQQLTSSDESSLIMTLTQFDSDNPHEVVYSSREIAAVPLLSKSSFQPRSRTPLYDALGSTISMAEDAHVDKERIVVVIFSDGLENASRNQTRKSIFDQVTAKRTLGWTFVFLGANQDSYAEGGGLGFSASNTENFAFDGQGVQAACEDVSKATKSMRSKLKLENSGSAYTKLYDSEDFFEGSKSAEHDYTSRLSSSFR